MGKKIAEKFKRSKLKHFRVSKFENKVIKKKAKNHRSEADYIRSKIL